MLKTTTKSVVDVSDWDDLVKQTYGKPYNFQQQDGCQDRGVYHLSVPSDYDDEDEMHNDIPEEVNGEDMGVKFTTWLARDPKEPLKDEKDGDVEWMIEMFWERNFYPSIHTLANDLYDKGLIEAGEYTIEIDW